jgi:hypothetical protein
MEQSAYYALDKLVLELDGEQPWRYDLDHLLTELSWTKARRSAAKPALYLSIHSNSTGVGVPSGAREVLRTDDFRGLESGDDFYLTDGASLFHLCPARGEGRAVVTSSFLCKSSIAQANFWCFGLLKLLRPHGLYSLHAAGLISPSGLGLLVVGPSGRGKSTLAIGLIREGWSYLSDDAVLLRGNIDGVEVLSCRRSFYIDAARAHDYADLPLAEEAPDSNGGTRRRIGVAERYAPQFASRCVPRVVVFPRLAPRGESALRRLDKARALGVLLSQSAPQLFDRPTMSAHLEVLSTLLQQTDIYELEAGVDLHRHPAKLALLISRARGEAH